MNENLHALVIICIIWCVGARYGRRATWIGANGDQTFLRIDESLINAHILAASKVFANQKSIGNAVFKC